MNPTWRLLPRQLRSHLRTTEWRALLLATWLAITLATLLTLLNERLELGLKQESAAMLGADLVISSQRPLQEARRTQAHSLGLETAEVVQFPSMIAVGEEMMLVSVRAVSSPYPLRGQINHSAKNEKQLPAASEIWAEPRILQQLEVEIGQSLGLGYSNLELSSIMYSSPDRGSGFRSFSPQVLISMDALNASEILAPGSRAEFRLLVAGDAVQLEAFSAWLEQHPQPEERIYSLSSEQPLSGGALNNVLSYLRLSGLIALLLSALTIYLSLQRFSATQHTRSALLLSLGMSQRSLLKLYSTQLFVSWLVLALLGTACGWLLEQLLLLWLQPLLPQALPAPSWHSYLTGSAVGLALLMLLGLPPLLQLSRVSIAHLLQSDTHQPTPAGRLLQLLCIVLLAAALLLFLSAPLAALTLLVLLLAGVSVFGTAAGMLLLWLAQRLAPHLLLGRLLRMRLRQQRHWNRLQAGVMILLLTLLSVIWISRTDLLADWQNQLDEDTPNYFLINIQPWQTDALQQHLQARHINHQLYPMVRGRISHLNGEPIHAQMDEQQRAHNTLNRELNLSWSAEPPPHNPISAGDWWPQGTLDSAYISVEREMADTLGLKLGDRLGFDLGGLYLDAEIRNLREVEWASFQPNFYVIFDPTALAQMPATYITSFRIDTEETVVLTELIRTFPSLTLIDIAQLLEQIKQWLQRLADSSAMILLLSLACGAALLMVTLQQALDQRRYEAALLQTLGAELKQTRRLDLLELGLLGGVCGVLAAASSELTLWLLYQHLLQLEGRMHLSLWWLLPLSSTLFFTLVGGLLRRPLSLPECYRLLRGQ